MDGVNFDALVAQERIILASQVNLDRDYFILGHFDNRRRDFKATDYPLYAIHARDLLAPATNNKDRQITSANAITSTVSSVYVDLPSMGLITSELDPILLNATGNYQIHFSCNYSLSDSASSANFILNINGADVIPTETLEGPISIGIFRTNIIWQVSSLLAGVVIKVKFKVIPGNPGSTINVYNRVLMIDGVNTITIV